MSRAFVKESDTAPPLPERMLSDGPNLVTREGYAQIEAHVVRLETALKDTGSAADMMARETLERDLRYWQVAKASAQIVPASRDNRAAFGSRVTIARQGRKQTFTIVGEDEADPARGMINFRSPLASAILGAETGDVIEADAPLGEIEILTIEN